MLEKLKRKTLNPNLLQARYAIRGVISELVNKIQSDLNQEEGKNQNKYEFKEIIYCNVGNPQKLLQKPLSFVRNVLGLVTCEKLLNSCYVEKIFNQDEIKRAKEMINMTKPGYYSFQP